MYEFYTAVVDGYLCHILATARNRGRVWLRQQWERIRLRGYPPPVVAPAAFNVKNKHQCPQSRPEIPEITSNDPECNRQLERGLVHPTIYGRGAWRGEWSFF